MSGTKSSAGAGWGALVILLVVIALPMLWIWSTAVDDGTAEPAQRPRQVTGMVGSVDVSVHPGHVCVTFSTKEAARCRLDVGYSAQRPEHASAHETWYGRQHILTVADVLPGQVYFRISGDLEDGRRFREAVSTAVVPAQPTSTTTMVSVLSDPTSTAVTAASEPVAIAETDRETTGKPVDQHDVETVARTESVPEDAPPGFGTPLPNADGASTLGRRALSASTIDRAFGPASVPPAQRQELMRQTKELQTYYDEYGGSDVARSLAQCYLDLCDHRRALQYATECVKANPRDVEGHRVRLAVYKKFAMGFKIIETYDTLRALCPDDGSLEQDYLRDRAIYGEFRTIGTPQRVSLK